MAGTIEKVSNNYRSLVADEIRKLASTSLDQSRSISLLLSDIGTQLSGIMEATKRSLESFSGINGKIGSINSMVTVMVEQISDQNRESRKVLDNIGDVDGGFSVITGESDSISAEVSSMHRQLESLRAAAKEILERVGHAHSTSDELQGIVSGFGRASRENRESLEILSEFVNKFKV